MDYYYLYLLGYGLLGFLDDFIKVVKKTQSWLNLKTKDAWSINYCSYILFYCLTISRISQRIFKFQVHPFNWNLAGVTRLLVIFMFVGSSNAVNLTDGLDGLLAGTAAIAFGAFGILAWYGFPQNEVTIFALAVVGALLGFLVFNAHPAKVFMGDTGSLALGGAIAAIAILTKLEIVLSHYWRCVCH